jgi:hypothetical protein
MLKVGVSWIYTKELPYGKEILQSGINETFLSAGFFLTYMNLEYALQLTLINICSTFHLVKMVHPINSEFNQ